MLISCTQSHEKQILKKGKAVLTGNVSNFQGDNITIRLIAEGAVENIERTVIIDSLSNFKAEIELYHPQDVGFNFKKGRVRIFLYPSDSIHLNIDDTVFSNERSPEYELSGNGKSISYL